MIKEERRVFGLENTFLSFYFRYVIITNIRVWYEKPGASLISSAGAFDKGTI